MGECGLVFCCCLFVCEFLFEKRSFQKQLSPCAKAMLSTPTWLAYLSDQGWQRTAPGTPVTAKANFPEEAGVQVGPCPGLPERVSSVVLPFTSPLCFLLSMISWRVTKVVLSSQTFCSDRTVAQ